MGQDELLDILTPAGVRLPGCARKPRRLVHRDGDWHAAVHVWLLAETLGDASAGAPGRGPWLLLQKRAACKDSWASMWDISAAGHVAAGDGSAETALREVEEELGVALPPDALELLFVYRQTSTDRGGAFINNEFNDVFMCTLPAAVPVAKLDAQPEEVEAVRWFPAEFVEFAWRERGAVPEFVPQNADGDDYGKLFAIIRERYHRSEEEQAERIDRLAIRLQIVGQGRAFGRIDSGFIPITLTDGGLTRGATNLTNGANPAFVAFDGT